MSFFGRVWNRSTDTMVADIRKRSIIRSGLGTLMVIPRERKLVRVYIQLSSCESPLPDKLQCEVITEAIRDALHPYSFSPKQVEWTTTYTVRNPEFPSPTRLSVTYHEAGWSTALQNLICA